MNYKESKKAAAFRKIYEFVCGRGADLNIFHFQYLAVKELRERLKPILSDLRGRVLDFGCGDQPYRKFLINANEYLGADIYAPDGGGGGTFLLIHNNKLPEIGEIDAVFSTQVLEHIENTEIFDQVFAALKTGGKAVISAPFLYHAHGVPYDFRRFTKEGIENWAKGYGLKVNKVYTQGAIASAVTILFLAWLNSAFNANNFTKAVKFLFLPLFIPFTFLSNLSAVIFDKADRTNSFYNNVIIEAEKCR